MKLMQQLLIKSAGNKQQFQHELHALGKMEEAFNALDQRNYGKGSVVRRYQALPRLSSNKFNRIQPVQI